MKTKLPNLTCVLWVVTGALCAALPAVAQVAGGTTTVDARIVESTQIAMGWSVKKTLMGKTIYNDAGLKVGKVEDLIISPGKLVMAGATKDMIKSMPVFTYAADTGQRDRFVATAEKDISDGKSKIADLEKKASVAATDTKAKIDLQITALKLDVKSAETKLGEMKQASAVRWKEFEASHSNCTPKPKRVPSKPACTKRG